MGSFINNINKSIHQEVPEVVLYTRFKNMKIKKAFNDLFM
jgi:hypothetical protein